jgi:two-component system, OmpR family, sensor histidine kinase MprB
VTVRWPPLSRLRLFRLRLFRPRLRLLTRFTLVAAGAVAATALAITAVAFIAVRTDLENQIRQQLAARAASVTHAARHYRGHIPYGWVPPHSDRFGDSASYTQVITASGATWAPSGDLGLLTPDAAAINVAAGRQAAFYADTRVGGVRVAVLTTPLAPGLAIQVVQSLSTTDLEVASVGATLALLSLIGIMVATVVGWAVARAGLAPVARLASVAEQVTATGDPGRRVAVGRRDELGRLATSFNSMLSALQRSLTAQRRLVSDASHELRTPLASLRLNVDLLADNPDMPAAERQEVLARVVDQVAELSQLVASVTELARGESPAAAREAVRLDNVTTAALDAARRDWPKTTFRADLDGCVVEGDADRLRVAIRNLLDNAAKFGPTDGPVQVRLAGGELIVRDHGPGIDPADLPHVFDRFYRSLSARAVPGSGLGLAVVREVARGHGGTVEAEPAPGGGTLMRLTLPTVATWIGKLHLPAAPARVGKLHLPAVTVG